MRTTILFLSMAMLFVISPYVHAQEVCYPGLEQIPQVLNEDAMNTGNFVGSAGQIYGTQIACEKSGTIVGILVVRGSGSGGSAQVVIYSDNNNSPDERLTAGQHNPSFPPIPSFPLEVDTTEITLSNPVEVVAGQKIWAGIKFSGNALRHLRQFPEADGLRFVVSNPFANAFPSSLEPMPSSNITNGIFGIYLIMEDCQDPPPPVDCTGLPVSYRADFNQDGIVSVDDLPVILGSFGSTGDCEDLNVDGFVNASDLGIFLSTFGATVDWQNIPE